MNYLAQGLTQGFQVGADAYNAKKRRAFEKEQADALKALREKQLDFEISNANREFNRKSGLDQFTIQDADRKHYRQLNLDEDNRGQQTFDNDLKTKGNAREDKRVDAGIGQGNRQLDQAAAKLAFEKQAYAETQGPGSPAYAYPLLMAQSANTRASGGFPTSASFGLDQPATSPVDNTPDGTIAVQDGVRYKKTNGQWIPIK